MLIECHFCFLINNWDSRRLQIHLTEWQYNKNWHRTSIDKNVHRLYMIESLEIQCQAAPPKTTRLRTWWNTANHQKAIQYLLVVYLAVINCRWLFFSIHSSIVKGLLSDYLTEILHALNNVHALCIQVEKKDHQKLLLDSTMIALNCKSA